jgi:hypothetical protein
VIPNAVRSPSDIYPTDARRKLLKIGIHLRLGEQCVLQMETWQGMFTSRCRSTDQIMSASSKLQARSAGQ